MDGNLRYRVFCFGFQLSIRQVPGPGIRVPILDVEGLFSISYRNGSLTMRWHGEATEFTHEFPSVWVHAGTTVSITLRVDHKRVNFCFLVVTRELFTFFLTVV